MEAHLSFACVPMSPHLIDGTPAPFLLVACGVSTYTNDPPPE